MYGLKAKGQDEGAHELEQRFAVFHQATVGGFISKIDRDGAVSPSLFGGFPHVSSPGTQVVRVHEGQWGEVLAISRVV
jgi:hypothetical protein